MPERDWRLRIDDIAVAIDKIERYTANMTLADFQADERTVDAVPLKLRGYRRSGT